MYNPKTTNFMDDKDSEPRPPPRFVPYPQPNIEKPVPQVPDVSLIESTSGSFYRSSGSGGLFDSSSSTTTSPPVYIQNICDFIKKQGEAIDRIERQVERLVHFQNIFLQNNNSNNNTQKRILIDKEVQTQTLIESQDNNDDDEFIKKREKNKKRNKKINSPSKVSKKVIQPSFAISDTFPEKTEDLSTILKELQLPPIQEQSFCSSINPFPNVDMQDFNDNESCITTSPGIPSASVYENSDDSDKNEIVYPTETFYKKILGNVNLLLDSNETDSQNKKSVFHSNPKLAAQFYHSSKDPAEISAFNSMHLNTMAKKYVPEELNKYEASRGMRNGPTDTTVYGLSSKNLSFATKNYLQKYGLASVQKNEAEDNEDCHHQHNYNDNIFNPPPRQNISPNININNNNNNDRILDIESLRNRPKLI